MVDLNQTITSADNAFDLKSYDEALELYRRALDIDPYNIEALLGEALSTLHAGYCLEATQLLEKLLPQMPVSDHLDFMLGEALYRAGKLKEAQSRFSALVERTPGYADAWCRLGSIHLGNGKNEDANHCFKMAVQVNPDHVEALCNIALMMIKFCKFDNALQVLNRALSLEPDNILALNNMGRACKMQGRHTEALGWYRKAMESEEGKTYVIDNYLFALNYCQDLEPQYVADEHMRVAGYYLPKKSLSEPVLENSSNRRLRIGYLSGDYYNHSVSYFVEPILKHHDYDKFDVFCYSVGSVCDETTQRMKSLPCVWREMAGMPPEVIIDEVRHDRIDILIDLAGHTADNRLQVFAGRAAPVQISWIGYPNTTGLPQMDYYITDNLCAPPGMTDHLFSESLWRLPRIFCCYLPPMEFPQTADAPFLKQGYITFGSFNNFAKVTDNQLDLWAQILGRVPGSMLYLKSMALGDRSVQDSVLERLARHGIAPERIRQRIVTKTPLEHLAEYGSVDIALDTFPYHGTTTTCEALWMGTPVITRAGNTHASRVGVSLLVSAGCGELVAADGEEYVAKAVALALDPARIIQYRGGLRTMLAKSPLMDCSGVTREVEAAFEEMYTAACREAGAV